MGDGRKLEKLLGSANASLALREFTFFENEFTPRPGDEKELADGVLWLEDRLVVFQVKERDAASDHSVAGLEKWFKEATRQIRDTHDYMREYDSIVVTNARGHRFDVNTKAFDPVVYVILYGSPSGFPEGFRPRKYHRSSTAGLFIHVLDFPDYVRLCAVLKTPIEVVDYLQFRERYLSEVEGAAVRTEKWLLGRFLISPDVPDPDLARAERDLEAAVDNLEDDASDFRAWKFLEGMGDRVAHNEHLGEWPAHHVIKETLYYDVLMAFARLRGTGMKAFSERIDLAIVRANDDRLFVSRFEDPREGIGYLVLGLPRSQHAEPRDYLLSLTRLNKYDRKLERCAGVSVCFGEDAVDIDWAWNNEPWAHDPTLEKILQEESPFPLVKKHAVPAYRTEIPR